MAGISDPEKSDLSLDLTNRNLGVGVDGNDKELDVVAQGDEDSEHSERSLSADSIKPTSAQNIQGNVRSKSQSSSIRSRSLSIIPRSKRRGLLGRFAIIPEVERPHDYGNGTKWAITAIVALAAAAAPVGSAIFYRGLSPPFLRGISSEYTNLFGIYKYQQCRPLSTQ